MLAWGYVIHFLRTIIMSNSLLGASLQNMTEFVKQNKQITYTIKSLFIRLADLGRGSEGPDSTPPPLPQTCGLFQLLFWHQNSCNDRIACMWTNLSLIALKNVLGRRVNKTSLISGFKLGTPSPFPTSPCQKSQDLPLRRLKWMSVIFSPVNLHRTRLTSPISAIHGMLVSCVPT